MKVRPNIVVLAVRVVQVETFCLIVTHPLRIDLDVHLGSHRITPIEVLRSIGRSALSVGEQIVSIGGVAKVHAIVELVHFLREDVEGLIASNRATAVVTSHKRAVTRGDYSGAFMLEGVFALIKRPAV